MKPLVIAILILLSGCAAKGPIFTPSTISDQDNPLIYVYRQCSFAGAAATLHIQINGEEVHGLKNCGYLFFTAEPGQQKVQIVNRGFQSWGGPEPIVEVNTKPGQVYFVRYSATAKLIPSGAGGLIPISQFEFREVDGDTGLMEIGSLNLSD